MAWALLDNAGKCNHHRLLPLPHHLIIEQSSSQLLSPVQIPESDQVVRLGAYLRSASPIPLVVQSFFQAVFRARDRLQDLRRYAARRLSFGFPFFCRLWYPWENSSSVSLIKEWRKPNICPSIPPIHQYIRHLLRMLLRRRYVSHSQNSHHRMFTQPKKEKKAKET